MAAPPERAGRKVAGSEAGTLEQWEGLTFTLKWSQRRRSLGLMVTTRGELVVSAPRGTSRQALAQALAKHRGWIARKLAERREALSRLQKGVAFFLGEPRRLTVAPAGQEAVELKEGELRVPLKSGDAGFWPLLKAWYRGEAERWLAARVRHFGARLGLAAGRLEVRDWRRRWGECRPGEAGVLRFNWRLILLPPPIIDYVVVHELVHLQTPGHSRQFWQQVGRVVPDYAPRRRWLNHYGSPFLLWEPEVGGGPGT